MALSSLETMVIIIGARPAGIAIAACLNLLSIPNIVLERQDCIASLWKKKSYDRLNLHLAKKYCTLPHMPFPSHFPTFISKYLFILYLDNYVAQFNINPLFSWSIESTSHDGGEKWKVEARNAGSREMEVFEGNRCSGKAVLVVGCGNSCTENAYDLCNYGARATISVHSPTKRLFNKKLDNNELRITTKAQDVRTHPYPEHGIANMAECFEFIREIEEDDYSYDHDCNYDYDYNYEEAYMTSFYDELDDIARYKIPTVATPYPESGVKILQDSTKFRQFYDGMGFTPNARFRMRAEDTEKTAFRTPLGNFYYTVMPFGLKNAGATYQHAMMAIFHDMLHHIVEDFVGDLVVKSKEKFDHLDT